MTEMEMVRELRRVVAAAAGQAGGNREKVKAEIALNWSRRSRKGSGDTFSSHNGCCRDQSLTESERHVELAGGHYDWVKRGCKEVDMTNEEKTLLIAYLIDAGEIDPDGDVEEQFMDWYRVREGQMTGETHYKALLQAARVRARSFEEG